MITADLKTKKKPHERKAISYWIGVGCRGRHPTSVSLPALGVGARARDPPECTAQPPPRPSFGYTHPFKTNKKTSIKKLDSQINCFEMKVKDIMIEAK